tara:strand:+ start:381 stop:788 length:408 start_codon:yes stop_codon:yes gene_type:complete
MQKKYILLTFFLILIQFSYSQNTYSDNQIRDFIKEVFSAQSNELVFQNPERYKAINRFFAKIKIELRNDIDINKKFDNYFDLPLNNKYNSHLQKDKTFSFQNFNPLKYKVQMFPQESKIYRLGNTQYLLFINPLK